RAISARIACSSVMAGHPQAPCRLKEYSVLSLCARVSNAVGLDISRRTIGISKFASAYGVSMYRADRRTNLTPTRKGLWRQIGRTDLHRPIQPVTQTRSVRLRGLKPDHQMV